MGTTRWFVVCEEYACGPFKTAEQAEGQLRNIERSAHCRYPHRVTSSATPSWTPDDDFAEA